MAKTDARVRPWGCTCFLCSVQSITHIFVVRAGPVSIEGSILPSMNTPGMQFSGTRIFVDRKLGTPIFWKRGWAGKTDSLYGPDWIDYIEECDHYPTQESAERDALMAVGCYPHLIGFIDVVQFQVRSLPRIEPTIP
jgi:hypothetical protein